MVDDAIVPIDEAQISAHDRSVYFGDGVYEVVRLCRGRFFEWDRHLARLERSLREMDMLEKVDLEQVGRRVDLAVEEARIPEALVYFQISRGSCVRSHDWDEDWKPGFLLTVRQYKSREKTATAITHPDWRWKRCDIKSLNLLANVLAKHMARKSGAYEAIMVDEKGMVTEATSSSALMIKDGAVRTAPLSANILRGITRELLLEWAAKLGLEVQEKSFTVAEALSAEELLITGTGTAVMGITHLDGHAIAGGGLGKYTKNFHELITAAIEGVE